MSGNDCWNKNVFIEVQRDSADWTSSGREFQKLHAATGNKQQLMLRDGKVEQSAVVWMMTAAVTTWQVWYCMWRVNKSVQKACKLKKYYKYIKKELS